MMTKKTKYTILEPSLDLRVDYETVNGLKTTRKILEVEGLECYSKGYSISEILKLHNALFIALIKQIDARTPLGCNMNCWKSKFYSDGTAVSPELFLAGITVHKLDATREDTRIVLPIEYWNKVDVIELAKAPEWDGHTSNDVIKRLLEL